MPRLSRFSPPVAGILCAVLSLPIAAIQAEPPRDLFSDTWVATDALGRSQPGIEEVGPPKQDKWVGIFYWTWHVPRGKGGPNDNTKILATARDGKVEWPENSAPHHWGEPELGYYMMTDPFVIRKHASMLVDAGVDAIFFDVTNPPFTWKDEYEALCRVYTQMREEGNRTPEIVFLCPFWNPTEVVNRVWNDLYRPGLWSDLWFRWEGKPLILADKAFLSDPEMLEFFTFRKPMPDYWLGPSGPEQWSWLEVHPQHVFLDAEGRPEQMSVGVAQNALPDTPGPAPMSHARGAMGRSWHSGEKDPRPEAVHLGLNFEEQWNRALEVDPRFVFVTGWNEWIAGRYTEWSTYTDKDAYYPGGLFVDQYNHEYSRDCEPMAGGHTDNYYYQLAGFIRRFKGVRPIPTAPGPAEGLAVDGDFSDWTEIQPEYRDAIGDTAHREHTGYGGHVYRNTTGRNDFVAAKAAYDQRSIHFLVEAASSITPHTDPMWMLLLIDSDQDGSTGWLGYEFIVNHEVTSTTETTIKKWDGGSWIEIGRAPFQVRDNRLELSISRSLIEDEDDPPAFDFHWADNIQSFEGVAELGVNGDSAPNRRWNYRFQVADE